MVCKKDVYALSHSSACCLFVKGRVKCRIGYRLLMNINYVIIG